MKLGAELNRRVLNSIGKLAWLNCEWTITESRFPRTSNCAGLFQCRMLILIVPLSPDTCCGWILSQVAAKHIPDDKHDLAPGTHNYPSTHVSAHSSAHSSDQPHSVPSLDRDVVGDSLRSHVIDPMQVPPHAPPLATSHTSHTHSAAHHRDRASKKGHEQAGESVAADAGQGVPPAVAEGRADKHTTTNTSSHHVVVSHLTMNVSISKVEDGKGREKGGRREKSEGKGDPLPHTKGDADDEHSRGRGEVGESGNKTLHPSKSLFRVRP